MFNSLRILYILYRPIRVRGGVVPKPKIFVNFKLEWLKNGDAPHERINLVSKGDVFPSDVRTIAVRNDNPAFVDLNIHRVKH